jgi:hypothetical protein
MVERVGDRWVCAVCAHDWACNPSRELRAFIDAVIVPALVARVLAEQGTSAKPAARA